MFFYQKVTLLGAHITQKQMFRSMEATKLLFTIYLYQQYYSDLIFQVMTTHNSALTVHYMGSFLPVRQMDQ